MGIRESFGGSVQVGDLVRCLPDAGIQGIIISLCDDHWEYRCPTADVYWINGKTEGQVVVMYQSCLEVVCK
jgi:hypothetical protein